MRLLDLDLVAYGPFTNLSLDLRSSEPGLHVVFGPNEAGKSVALRALSGLLYGIEVRTTDDFVHDKASLKIGARIRSAGGAELAFVRHKRRANTLVNPDTGAFYPDDVLQPFLGGVDEDTFRRVYGIGHAQLVEGGRTLRMMKGLAGESLFAAGMAGVSLGDVLQAIHQEANELRTARGGTIRGYLSDYKAARSAKEDACKPAHEWEKLDEELTELQAKHVGIRDALERARADHARCQRLLRAVPLVSERRALLTALAESEGVRVLPAAYSQADRVEAARRIAGRLEVEQTRAELDGEDGVRSQIARLVIPEELIRQADTIGRLRQSLGAYVKASADLSNLRTRRDVLHADAMGILRELQPGAEWHQVDALRLPPERKVRIQGLASQEKHAREQPKLLAARQAEAAAELQRLQAELAALGATEDPGPLARALRIVRKHGDLDKQRAEAAREARQVTASAERALQRLGLPATALATVDTLAVPTKQTIERFAGEMSRLEEELRALSKDTRTNQEEAERTAREIAALREERDVPSESSLLEARSQREAGWALVKGQWLEGRDDAEAVRRYAGDLGLAGAYEGHVRVADDVSDRLRRDADDVARLANLLATQDGLAVKRRAIDEQTTDVTGRREELTREWQAAWTASGVPARTPAEMREWLVQHDKIVALLEDLRKRQGALDDLDQRIATDRASLAEALVSLGQSPAAPDESLAALVERSEDVCERLEATRSRRAELDKEIGKQTVQQKNAARDLLAAEEALSRWRDDWRNAVATIGCDADTTGPEANERIARIDELLTKVRDVGEHDRRIESIERDASELAHHVEAFAGRVAPDLVGRPVEEAIGELGGRFDEAREDAQTLKHLIDKERKLATQLAEDEASLADAQATLDRLCRLAGVDDPDELAEAERLSAEKSQRQARLAVVHENLTQLAADQPVDEFVQGVQNPDALDAQLHTLQNEIDSQDAERTRIDQRIGEIRREMGTYDGSDRAAAADEKALGILARIRQATERFVALKVAAAFLERQVERHRAETQDPILTRASQIFATLTCGAFEGLATDVDEDDQPIVVGVRAGGSRQLAVEQMSDGTADQLYLSLRLAYLEQQLQSREPLPVILDDILVNFDDTRAEATLHVLGELGKRTQVLLFNHHERNVDLARAAVPGDLLKLHRLAGFGACA